MMILADCVQWNPVYNSKIGNITQINGWLICEFTSFSTVSQMRIIGTVCNETQFTVGKISAYRGSQTPELKGFYQTWGH